MKMFFNIPNPDDIEFTLTVTMPLKEWRRLRDQLGNSYPSWRFANAIRILISKANESFENDAEEIKDV